VVCALWVGLGVVGGCAGVSLCWDWCGWGWGWLVLCGRWRWLVGGCFVVGVRCGWYWGWLVVCGLWGCLLGGSFLSIFYGICHGGGPCVNFFKNNARGRAMLKTSNLVVAVTPMY